MWVQTWHPQHALYAALRQHDFAAFAERQSDVINGDRVRC